MAYISKYSGEDIDLRLDLINKLTPRNLLDNSDFRNPVNQRGQTSYTINYGFDRWRIYSESTAMTKNDGYMTVTGVVVAQNVPDVKNKIYTFSAMTVEGTLYLAKGTFESGAYDGPISFDISTVGQPTVFLGQSNWLWAALYEGEYTAETLPEYQPKGYGAELAECQRYYVAYNFSESFLLGKTYSSDGTKADIQFFTSSNLRLENPTIVNELSLCMAVMDGINYPGTLLSATASGNTVSMIFQSSESMPLTTMCMLRMIGKFALSADL